MTLRAQRLAGRRELVAKLRLHRRSVTWLGLAFSAVGVALIAFRGSGPWSQGQRPDGFCGSPGAPCSLLVC